MRLKLTKKQAEVYEFMQNYFKENDMLPSSYAIRDHFKTRIALGQYYQRAIRDKGWIEHNAVGKYRFTREGAQA